MIFKILDDIEHMVNVGKTVGVARTDEFAYLPAVHWERDVFTNAICPQMSPNAYGWFTFDNGLRQVLRDPFNTEPKSLDEYLLESENYYIIGRVLGVYAAYAEFEVLHFAEKSTVNELQVLSSESLRRSIEVADAWRSGAYAVMAFFNYRLYLNKRPLSEFKELVDRLPHGAGLDGNWTIDDTGISIGYHMMNENGFYDSWMDVAWEISKKNGRWILGDYIGDTPEMDATDFDCLVDDLATEIERALNHDS